MELKESPVLNKKSLSNMKSFSTSLKSMKFAAKFSPKQMRATKKYTNEGVSANSLKV